MFATGHARAELLQGTHWHSQWHTDSFLFRSMSIPGIPLPVTPPRRTATPQRGDLRTGLGLWVARIAAIAALLIASYLAYASIAAGGRVAGCDDTNEAGCGHVLTSRWASWVGIPVGVPAVLVYLVAVAATWMAGATPTSNARRIGWILLAAIAVLVGGAAIWFLGLQLLALGNLCWYCLTLHACGLLLACFVAWRLPQEIVSGHGSPGAAFLAAGFGALGLAALVGGQLLFVPETPGMQVVEIDAKGSPAKPPFDDAQGTQAEVATDGETEPQAETESVATTEVEHVTPTPTETTIEPPPLKELNREPEHPWSHRRLSLLGGSASLDIYDYPVIGDREARRPLVEVFDYTCPHCRELFEMVKKVQPDYGDGLTVVLLPIAMNKKCNEFVTTDHAKHATACELTRLAIAVWQAKPDVFEKFHAGMMKGVEPPSPDKAEAAAARLIGSEQLKRALASPTVDAQLKENCRLYSLARDSSRDGSIPKLIYDRAVANGLPKSEEQFRLFLEKQVGLKPQKKK